MRSGYEEKLPALLSKPSALRTQPRRPDGLSGREGKPDVAAGHGGANEIELGRIRGRDLLEVIGSSVDGGGGRWDVASHKGANLYLSACDVHAGRERV